MKRLILFFFVFPAHLYAQLYIDFESDYLENWKQSRDSAWILSESNAISGKFSLWHCLDDLVGSDDRISFPYDSLVLDSAVTIWEFKIRHGYNPSSSNKWAIYLLSEGDQSLMQPGAYTRAILLGVNFKGSDDILKLWKTTDGESEILSTTSINWQETIGTETANLRIRKDPGNNWQVFRGIVSPSAEKSDSTVDWELVGVGQDTGGIRPGYFGIYYRYSSRQDRKLWFDDLFIRGHFIKDCISPELIKLEVLNAHTLRIYFSEAVDKQTAANIHFYEILMGENQEDNSGTKIFPDTIRSVTERIFDLVFNKAFESGRELTLLVKGISDLKGNASPLLDAGFIWNRNLPGDMIINEVMFDPFPAIGLPGYEYIELFSPCNHPVNLDGWTLRAGSGMIRFPPITIQPGEYLLICPKGRKELFGEKIQVLDLMKSTTVLSNEGGRLLLQEPDSVLIDWMEYTAELHSDPYFAGGGWSLERIDPERCCFGSDNWTSSISIIGGTPGLANSVLGYNPDRTPPVVASVYVGGPSELVILFSEAMNRVGVLKKEQWIADGGLGMPDSVRLSHPGDDRLTLEFKDVFKPGREYHMKIQSQISDCTGNPINTQKIRFALPLQPQFLEILISEVLFNPLPWCPDFVEIFNPTLKTFDLADLRLATRDAQNCKIISVTPVLNGNHLLFPGEYLVFTNDPESLTEHFLVQDLKSIVRVKQMPSFGDEKGCVLILDKFLNVLDELFYDENMHHPMLGNPEGVSLERISYDAGSGELSNWHSASSTQGYGTPGRKNSQAMDVQIPAEGFELEPGIFSPDMDGIKDLLIIKYRFFSPGNRARILVLDSRGRLIREIGQKQLLGTEGFFTWDGTDNNGHKARTGIYLVFAELYGTDGKVRRFRKTCVLSTGQR